MALGFAFAPGFRFEGELSARGQDIPTTEFEGTVSGDSRIFAAMGNVWYDFELGSVTPYIGGGVGVANVKFDITNTDNHPEDSAVDDSDTVFAYQLGAGVKFAATEDVTVSLDYRFLGASDVSVAAGDPDFGIESDVANHSVMIGLQFDLGSLGR